MFLSVVIPTRNRASSLQNALQSICGQTYDAEQFEVIVIDNGSSDNTPVVCDAYHDKIHNFRYIRDEHPGLHVGRNRGYLESRGEVVVYADDDIIAPQIWLKSIRGGVRG